MENASSDWEKDPKDNSRAALVRETFYEFCHMKEFVHQALKENDQKWIAMRHINNNRMDAILELNKTQDNGIKVFEKVIKNYSEGDLNKFFEIQNQLKSKDKRAVNKAMNEMNKTEQEVVAADKQIGMWEEQKDYEVQIITTER